MEDSVSYTYTSPMTAGKIGTHRPEKDLCDLSPTGGVGKLEGMERRIALLERQMARLGIPMYLGRPLYEVLTEIEMRLSELEGARPATKGSRGKRGYWCRECGLHFIDREVRCIHCGSGNTSSHVGLP